MLRARMFAAFSIAAATTASIAVATAESASAAPAPVPVVHVYMGSDAIRLNQGQTHIHAGRTTFRVLSTGGDHVLQIARLHAGYTLGQAESDLNQAFSGDVAAVRRVDSHITFYGGAEATPNHPGAFSVRLLAATYLFIDQNGPAHLSVGVVGTAPANQAAPPRDGTIGVFTYGFTNSANLPHSGWARVFDQSDQPHFIVLQHVKAATTARNVRLAFANPNSQPTWALRETTSSGVLSPNISTVWHYNLPAGKYLMACFWPDDDTGMPHAFMGMWKLVWLH